MLALRTVALKCVRRELPPRDSRDRAFASSAALAGAVCGRVESRTPQRCGRASAPELRSLRFTRIRLPMATGVRRRESLPLSGAVALPRPGALLQWADLPVGSAAICGSAAAGLRTAIGVSCRSDSVSSSIASVIQSRLRADIFHCCTWQHEYCLFACIHAELIESRNQKHCRCFERTGGYFG